MIIFIVEEISYCPEGTITGKKHFTFSNPESLENFLKEEVHYCQRSLIGCDLIKGAPNAKTE